jgi:transposase
MQHEYCTHTLPFRCERRRMGASPAPYLSLQSKQALQRKYALREVYNGLRWLVRTGAQWRMLPHGFPRLRTGLSTDAALVASGLL